MKIVLMVEGATEAALKHHLKAFLDRRAAAEGKRRVRLETREIVTTSSSRLKHRVRLELKNPETVAVVGLVDVYPNFQDAAEAKAHLRQMIDHPRFYAHAAQFEVEAWLLPYWEDICRRVGVQKASPGSNPESVNRLNPPSRRLQELYRRAKPPRKYVKATEMYAILQGKDLTVSANRCPEFKAFLNTLLTLSHLEPLP